jgi:hypothetical protein
MWREFRTDRGVIFTSHERGGGDVTIEYAGQSLTCPRGDVIQFHYLLHEAMEAGPLEVTRKASRYIRSAISEALQGERESFLANLARFGADDALIAKVRDWATARNQRSNDDPFSET